MPTRYGTYELPRGVVEHRRLVVLLLAAMLPPGSRHGCYTDELSKLVVRFWDRRTVPLSDELEEALRLLFDELRWLAFGDLPVADDDGRYGTAAHYLRLAEQEVRASFGGQDDGEGE